MEKITLHIVEPIGVHTKIAAGIVNIASQYESDIFLTYNKEKVNLKSILNILALGITCNSLVEIEISGLDEKKAMQSLFNYLYHNKIAKEVPALEY